MTIERDTSLRDVAFEVCSALDRAGATAVLTGGGAATLYAPEAIQSFDLDFVLTLQRSKGAPVQALEALGYRRTGHHYTHSANPFLLEFPAGPLAIGDELITAWNTLREDDRLLHVLSPTDSCRDRLAAFYHFHDQSSLESTLAIHAAQSERVDLERIRRWSVEEGAAGRFEEFLRRLPG